ncbi:MAG: response regulator [Flavobacteriales bacterium]|nr:response regulator [Flavobacteriales bacterium]
MSTRILDIDGRTDIPRVLFVDDDAGNRQAFHAAFRKEFDVMTASGMEEAWHFLTNRGVDVLITDQRMPGTPGSELLRLVRERFPQVRRMLVTGYSDLQALADAINQGGVTNYIAKPWDPDEVRQLVGAAFAEVRAERDRSAYTQRLIESNRQLEFALRQRLLS